MVEYSALQIKQAVVGGGRAAKEQVQHMVRVLLGGSVEHNTDTADALACAICHIHSSAHQIVCLRAPCCDDDESFNTAASVMIAFLKGQIIHRQAPRLVLDVQGVGYELEAPLTTFYDLPEDGQMVELQVHMVVREDAQLLYGFSTLAQRDLFRSLLKVNGVGPRVRSPSCPD